MEERRDSRSGARRKPPEAKAAMGPKEMDLLLKKRLYEPPGLLQSAEVRAALVPKVRKLKKTPSSASVAALPRQLRPRLEPLPPEQARSTPTLQVAEAPPAVSDPPPAAVSAWSPSPYKSFTASLNLDARYLEEFEAGNFLYLQRKPHSDQVVYDLQVVEHYETNPASYYTMSKAGITHFTPESSDFSPLDKWELEYSRFVRMRQIPFFQKYRMWKNYNVWKQNIRSSKMKEAKAALEKHLFLLNPQLQPTLLALRKLTLQVTQTLLLRLVPKKIYTLAALEADQKEAVAELTASLHTFSASVLQLCVAACDAVVDLFLERNKIVAEHKMTFMERAALRKECRGLTNFVRLADLLVIDAMLQLSIHSFQHFLQQCRSAASPLFSVTVAVVAGAIVPTPGADAWTASLESILKQCLTVLDVPDRLLGHPMLLAYTNATAEDEGKAVWSIAQLNLASLLNDDAVFAAVSADIFATMEEAFDAIDNYLEVFEPYFATYSQNIDAQEHPERFYDASIEMFGDAITLFQEQQTQFKGIPATGVVGVFRVESDDFKQQLLPTPGQSIVAIKKLLPKLMKKQSVDILDELAQLSPLAFGAPSKPDAFVEKVVHMHHVTNVLPTIKLQYRRVYDMAILMDNYEWRVPDDIKEDIILMKEGVLSLEGTLAKFDAELEGETTRFTQLINDMLPPLARSVEAVTNKLQNPKLETTATPIADALRYLHEQEVVVDQLAAEAARIKEYQLQLKQSPSEFQDIQDVVDDLHLKTRLWTALGEWERATVAYNETPFGNIDVDAMSSQVQGYLKLASQAMRALPASEVAATLQGQVEQFKLVLPVVLDLRGSFLQDRHWAQIHDILGFVVKGDASLTLGTLMARQAMTHGEAISVVSVSAQQESVLEAMLHKVVKVWQTLELEVKPYKEAKDVFVLGAVDEVLAALDDSIVTINTILGSRFIGAIREEVDGWRRKLVGLQETLDEWLLVQKNWMYIETIFSAPDIQRQLPDASKVFAHVDASWKAIMKRTADAPLAITAGSFPGIKETLTQHNAHLDRIQKSLEDYLETKRMAFPRFYFLSNDELLEILAQSKNPHAVQPHLRKCFENLVKLEFGDGSVDMVAMLSAENERVPLGKNLKARGNVEDWLKALEGSMKASIYKLMKLGLADYDTRLRKDWVVDHPGQVVATVAQMTWARQTEAVLRGAGSLQAWLATVVEDLNDLIVKIRGKLSSLERKVIVALVTTDVHARDIVECLLVEGVADVGNFIWQQQLRYYWDADADDVVIKHSDSVIKYGYEYMGATSRLVITPLTDRCWMTLTGAYGLKLGAAPAGPAGTGKTESSKDLAKAMAIQCVVFNCSDQIDYKMMGKLFRGLAQAGNWTCLDEFNRIDIEVLSVVAQQLLTLREGRLQEKEHINFMGVEILLKDHHVIVTMNPGYAGRTELPDNLKVCFRPVSMMVPDYALIAEIMLFAEGFGDAKTLSRKMCKLYILCSEQLSQQPHYDYGLRAVKSVLVMAGSLKRANPTLPEDVTLIRALRDSNVPKFLSDDLPLFQAIVYDLFPGIDIPSNDYGELLVALEAEVAKARLQKVPTFVTKIIQLFDTFNVRFGGTLVGPAGAGKTTCYRMLQNIMTTLREQGSGNQLFQAVHARVLNPKCITMGELYGEFNELTQEWHDGLASMIMREAVTEDSSDFRWTVFDGPIDALWIENMNTVLDDNMTLCLANGERIKLKTEMRMLFEVMDLCAASPATVSRIGVVYMTSTDVGWRPFVQTWLQTRPFPAPWLQRLEAAIAAVVDKMLQFLRQHCTEPVPTVDIQLVTHCCRLLDAFLPQLAALALPEPADQLELVLKLFCFALVWSLGASMSHESLEAFDAYFRGLLETAGIAAHIPTQGLVFDYYVDLPSKRFAPWADIVPDFNMPYFDMIVATPDTIRYTYLLRVLTTNQTPAYITGITGTGKTVIIMDLLRELTTGVEDEPAHFCSATLSFSAQTSSLVTQATIEAKLEKKRKNLLGPFGSKRMVIFVDDVNLPAVEMYGAQAPIELLRQFLDFRGFYDRDKLFWKDIADTLVVCAAAPAGGGRSHCTPRFVRHFHVLCMHPAREASLKQIFAAILGGFLERFTAPVKALRAGIIGCVIDVYNRVCSELLPTPSKFHYTFNLRDVSKVFQGILMVTPAKCPDADTMHKLWVHEAARVFGDRLNTAGDASWFEELVTQLLASQFHVTWSKEALFHSPCPLLFGDIFKPGTATPLYELCEDAARVTRLLESANEDYNMRHSNKMNLVFFRDAIAHLLRLTRVLRQPRGNAMLIGVGGSGKQSLARLAAFAQEASCHQIEITRGYGSAEFHEDIKSFMLKAGVQGLPTVFLFTDSQIVDESFLEDINNILNSGEVPNLFAADELDRVVADMRPVVKALGLPETRDQCLTSFVYRVRNYLHIVLCMSPVGSALRVRCRAFPSLINCCTIDWYMNWPKEALQSVASRFLAHIALPTEAMRAALIDMCSIVHTTANDVAVVFQRQLQRHVYTTPKSYLDLIQLYLKMLKEKTEQLQSVKMRMEIGVKKLEETNGIVDALKAELIKLQPVLTKKAAEAEVLLKQVSVDQKAAAEVRARVSKDEAVVGKQAEEVAVLQADAQKDLDVAMPALRNAENALNSLSKSDITEVKSFTKPPEAVETVMQCVCLLLGEKQTWEAAKKLLGDSTFLERLIAYDKDNIPDALLKKLSKCVANPGMSVEVVSKVSKAATSLCMWAHAMDVYSKVAKEVGPKKANLEAMNAKLEAANAVLQTKQEELRKVNENVMRLEKQCKDTLDEKDTLAREASTTEKRLVRAEKLISGLSVEGKRWKETVASLADGVLAMIGDTFLAAASISYYGAFTGSFRQQMVDTWLAECDDRQIPSSGAKYSLAATLGSPVEVREWQLNGLPTDMNSTDNAILATRGERWPLMIDPQGQANKWVKKTFAPEATKMTNANLLRALEGCIRNGRSLLIEDVEETLEPSLEPILQKAVFKQGGRLLLHLGDSDVDYDPSFRLWLTTKGANPHYLPEVYIKVTIINFTVTMTGLEDQLLGDAVKHERPDIEEKKNRLVVTMAQDKKQLKDIEDRILQKLSESSGNVLDDEGLIDTLASSNATSKIIKERVQESEATELEINRTREEYRSVATRGSILYFVVAQLATIDPMYQYSLPFFQRLFNICFDATPPAPVLAVRLGLLIDFQTTYIYTNICRGLFEVHKVLFSVLICCKIMLHDGRIAPAEWSLFLRGVSGTKHTAPNPAPDVLSDAQWALLQEMEAVVGDAAAGLVDSLSGEWKLWLAWLQSSDGLPNPVLCPRGLGLQLSAFQHVLLMKGLAQEKVQRGLLHMLTQEMAAGFGELGTVSMEEIYKDTDKKTPCIFVLSAGADPTGLLLRFAKDRQFSDRLHLISLGQGQGPRAEALIETSKAMGDWVLLQNCHLAKSWMPALEKKVEELAVDPTVQDTFRLFLTSFPAAYFPVTVLQNGIKLTNEPPKGIRANLLRSFATLQSADGGFFDAFDSGGAFDEGGATWPKAVVWKKLLSSLVFFHAVIQERRKFGALGWNIKYEFNDTDLETSYECLKKFLTEQPTIPWDALRYVTGQINYGGRVTDDWDRRCLTSILNGFYTPAVLQDSYRFSASGTYFAPAAADLVSVVAYFEGLPVHASPEIFGMHENANVTFERTESWQMTSIILGLEPRDGGGSGGASSDDTVLELAAAIQAGLPPPLRLDEAGPTTFKTRTVLGTVVMDSLATVLSQELVKFNHLLGRMKGSLADIQRAIQGLIVMSSDLDNMYTAFLNGKVPGIWEVVSFASLKSLGPWVQDLLGRVDFFRRWLVHGEPVVFPLPAFFFPQGFMTGTLQNFARKYQTAIDCLGFTFAVLDVPATAVRESPSDGIYVDGLWLEGARWNAKKRSLEEARPGEMFSPMALVHFLPAANIMRKKEEYPCPVYKTSVRKGTLSTTGMSTNFVVAVYLPTRHNPDHWVLNGAAFLLNLD
ncbi:dynein heavy chain [Achlya hypogyna]|uniref:Dynein heavy chain n=1 Tax=Achlya hypogyna TaxID=1202772 RepID=A0A1V9YA21_ACHHY|nr:dynein heavy chain [Achlya hypogyna]